MDWSFGGFKDKVGGLMDPTAQRELLASPMFRTGMGLLASNKDGSNPYEAVVQGLQGSKAANVFDEDRERIEQLRKQLAALLMQQQQPQMGPPAPPQGAPGMASFQQLGMPGGQMMPGAPMGPPRGLMGGP